MGEAATLVLVVGVHVFVAVVWLRFIRRGGHVRVGEFLLNPADRIDRWTMERHEAERIDDDVLCFAHGRDPQPWPCHEWTEAAERRQVRRHAMTKAPTTRQET